MLLSQWELFAESQTLYSTSITQRTPTTFVLYVLNDHVRLNLSIQVTWVWQTNILTWLRVTDIFLLYSKNFFCWYTFPFFRRDKTKVFCLFMLIYSLKHGKPVAISHVSTDQCGLTVRNARDRRDKTDAPECSTSFLLSYFLLCNMFFLFPTRADWSWFGLPWHVSPAQQEFAFPLKLRYPLEGVSLTDLTLVSIGPLFLLQVFFHHTAGQRKEVV